MQTSARVSGETFAKFYKYDRTLALHFTLQSPEESESYIKHKLTFVSVDQEKVSGYLALPRNGKSDTYPCVLLLHGTGGSKDGSISWFVESLAQAGYASVAVDAVFFGERKVTGVEIKGLKEIKSYGEAHAESYLKAARRTIVGWRIVLDYLETRNDIDMGRIGLIGVSMGASRGVVLAGVDERIRTLVLLIGGGDFGLILGDIDLGQKWASFDPINFAPNLGHRAVLMQNGLRDEVIPPEASLRLYKAFKGPKQIDWYDKSHNFNYKEVLPIVTNWLNKYLTRD